MLLLALKVFLPQPFKGPNHLEEKIVSNLLALEKRGLGYLLCRALLTFDFGVFEGGKVVTADEGRSCTWGLSQDPKKVRHTDKIFKKETERSL